MDKEFTTREKMIQCFGGFNTDKEWALKLHDMKTFEKRYKKRKKMESNIF